jgi:hypothetical protein
LGWWSTSSGFDSVPTSMVYLFSREPSDCW